MKHHMSFTPVEIRNLNAKRKNIFFVAFSQTKQTIIGWSVLFGRGIGIDSGYVWLMRR